MQNQSWRPSNNLSQERIARYVLFPEILPRVGELFRGFRHFAFIIAIIFSRAGIFRSNHSFLNPHNIGKFTLGDVLGTAAASIRYNRQSLPQTAIFLSVIGMMSIITLQLILALVIYFSGEAHAAASLPVNFTAPNPDEDIALNFLSLMLGTYDFMGVPLGFGSGPVDRQVTSLHTGFHELLAFYNVVMMLMGAFIMGYYAVAAFLETALTGVPFGRRFSGYAAPLRAVIAFAILIPLPMPPNVVGVSVSGFNAAQYLVLFSARQGSNFASNLFNIFVAAVIDPDHAQDYLAEPTVPDVARMVEGIFNMMLCMHANDRAIEGQRDHLNRAPPQMAGFWRQSDGTADGWTAAPLNTPGALLNAYRADLAANPGGIGNLQISAGPAADKDLCGVLTIDQNKVATEDAASTEDAYLIMQAYIEALDYMVNTSGAYGLAYDIVELTMSSDNNDGDYGDIANLTGADRMQKDQWMAHIRSNILLPVFQDAGSTISTGGASQWRQRLETEMGTNMIVDRGWAGAALFYNDISEANLVLQNAAKSVPKMTERPGPLENYEATKKSLLDGAHDGAMSALKDEMPKIAEEGVSLGSLWSIGWGGIKGFFRQGYRKVKQEVLNRVSGAEAFEAELGEPVGVGAEWFKNLPTAETGYREPETIWGELGEVALRAVGLGALADLMNDDPREVNPIGTMAQLGSTLKDTTKYTAILGIIMGGINRFGSAAAGNFLLTMSAFMWTMGMFLANVLPILPFIYFFFGVVQWGFSVFEAIVAAPMLALTHLRFTSGDDRLIPQNAVQGYLMIFEIFLRPLMLIFGLIASITVFTAASAMLHDIFFVAAYEMLGAEAATGPIDTLATVVVYIIFVYMLAMMTFKLITIIPLGIMRWFGLGAAASLDDVTREAEGEQSNLIQNLAAMGGASWLARRGGRMPEQGPGAVKTKDGKELKLTVRPDGQMFAKLQDGSIARVKELNPGNFVMVDPTARGGLTPVSLVMKDGWGGQGWNAEAMRAKHNRDELRTFGRAVGRVFGIGPGKVS